MSEIKSDTHHLPGCPQWSNPWFLPFLLDKGPDLLVFNQGLNGLSPVFPASPCLLIVCKFEAGCGGYLSSSGEAAGGLAMLAPAPLSPLLTASLTHSHTQLNPLCPVHQSGQIVLLVPAIAA